jgi:hypothetical protein
MAATTGSPTEPPTDPTTGQAAKRGRRSAGGRPVAAPDPQPTSAEAAEPGHVCTVAAEPGHVCTVAFCPIGLALVAAERVQPDVVSHLLVAGREFFLAAKAVMDARAEDLGADAPSDGPARMEHIDIG